MAQGLNEIMYPEYSASSRKCSICSGKLEPFTEQSILGGKMYRIIVKDHLMFSKHLVRAYLIYVPDIMLKTIDMIVNKTTMFRF